MAVRISLGKAAWLPHDMERGGGALSWTAVRPSLGEAERMQCGSREVFARRELTCGTSPGRAMWLQLGGEINWMMVGRNLRQGSWSITGGREWNFVATCERHESVCAISPGMCGCRQAA